MRLSTFFLDLFFPPKCAFCGRLLVRGEDGLCGRCQRDLPWIAGRAAEQKPEFCALCVSPLWYQGEVRASFHRYKFDGRVAYAVIYGRVMAQCVGDHLDGRYDLITWAPLSAKRQRRRGYDQAFLLAKAISSELGSAAVGTLVKGRDTPRQSDLSGDGARRANVLGAYSVAEPALVRGKRILLVDDVVTTGATLSECARVLRTAGAADVVCVTFARARKE